MGAKSSCFFAWKVLSCDWQAWSPNRAALLVPANAGEKNGSKGDRDPWIGMEPSPFCFFFTCSGFVPGFHSLLFCDLKKYSESPEYPFSSELISAVSSHSH